MTDERQPESDNRLNNLLKTHRYRNSFLLITMGIIAIAQIGLSLKDYGVLWSKRVWRMRAYPSMERGAIFLLGGKAAAYVHFLEVTIPQRGTLVIPPSIPNLSEQNILQYFLFPRPIVSCGCDRTNAQGGISESCLQCLETQGYYLPAIGDFPPQESLSDSKQLLPFGDSEEYYRGVYAPIGSDPHQQIAAERQFNLISTATSDLMILLAIGLLGAALTIIILQRMDWSELLIFSLPLGLGTLTWFAFLLSWAGIRLSIISICILYLFLLGIGSGVSAILISKLGIRLQSPLGHLPKSKQALSIIVLGGLLLLLLLTGLLSIGRSYSSYDPIANWSLKGYAIADLGTVYAGQDWGGHGLAYPLNLPLMISLFRIVNGDVLPGSKALFPIFTGILLLGCYHFWQRRKVDPTIATMASLVLLSTPFVFRHATQGFSNLPFSTYLVLGVLWCLIGVYQRDTRSLRMAGVMLALASWTRPEGIGFSLIFITVVYLGRRIQANGKLNLILLLGPIFVIYGAWLLFASGFIAGDSVWEALPKFFDATSRGNFGTNALAQTIQFAVTQALQPKVWGFAFLLSVSFSILGWRKLRPRKDPMGFTLALISLSAWIIPISLFFVASFSRTNFDQVLEFNFDRALFPALFLTTVMGISNIAGSGKWDKGAAESLQISPRETKTADINKQ